MIEILQQLNNLGFWGMLNTAILLAGAIFGLWLTLRHVKYIRDVNFYVTWQRNEIGRFPLILRFEVRNLLQNMVVINTPYFRFDKVRPGPFAHCDSASQRYEIKFKRSDGDKESEVACLLRHREIVTSYIPLAEDQTDEELFSISRAGRVGTLYCDVIFLTSKPKVIHLRLKLKNVVPYKGHQYPRETPLLAEGEQR